MTGAMEDIELLINVIAQDCQTVYEQSVDLLEIFHLIFMLLGGLSPINETSKRKCSLIYGE